MFDVLLLWSKAKYFTKAHIMFFCNQRDITKKDGKELNECLC